MGEPAYLYKFPDSIDMTEVEETLLVSVLAVEALHGRTGIQLDAEFSHDPVRRQCSVFAGSRVGQDIARIFTGLLSMEFGESSFTVDQQAGADACD